MLGNARITSKQRQKIAVVAADERSEGLRQVVIDERTVWTGKPFGFAVGNGTRYERWYRVSVTDLTPDDYVLYTQDQQISGEDFVPVPPSGEAIFTVITGGMDERQPSQPQPFEVIVLEYALPDEDSPHSITAHFELQWIPGSRPEDIAVETFPEAVPVRPWDRRARFEIMVSNRGHLPVSVGLRVGPSGNGAAPTAVLPLEEPLPPLQKQTLTCTLPLESRFKEPVGLRASADVAVRGREQSFAVEAPRLVRLVPVPFLRAWQDWVAVAVAGFLLVWLLWGMPPFVHTHARVTLHFTEGLPPNITPQDLSVSLTPVNRDQPGRRYPAQGGHPLPATAKNQLEYEFDWGWRWRAFRWQWKKNELSLSIDPGKKKALLTAYELSPRLLAGVRQSSEFGVFPRRMIVPLELASGVTFGIAFDPGFLKRAASEQAVNLTFAVDGEEKLTKKFLTNRLGSLPPIRLPENSIQEGKRADVTITAQTLPNMREAEATIRGVTPTTEKYQINLQPRGARVATVSIPGSDGAPFDYVIKDSATNQMLKKGSSGGEALAASIPLDAASKEAIVNVSAAGGAKPISRPVTLKPGETSSFGDWESKVKPQPSGPGPVPIKPLQTGPGPVIINPPQTRPKPVITKQPQPRPVPVIINPPQTRPRPVEPHSVGLPPKQVENWSNPLDITGSADALIEESKKPDALRLTTFKAAPGQGGQFTLSVTANQSCYVQIYDIERNEAGQVDRVDEVLGPDETTYPGMLRKTPKPWLLEKGKRLSVTLRSTGSREEYVALAVRAGDEPPQDKLEEQLNQAGDAVSGWTIGGTTFTPQ
jgi:hypothetical protein